MMKFHSLYNIKEENFWAYTPTGQSSGGYASLIRNHPFTSHFSEWGNTNILYFYPHELNNDSLINLGANGNLKSPVCQWILVPITADFGPDFSRAFPLGDIVEGDVFV